MKRFLFILCVLSYSFLSAKELEKPFHVYLCSRLTNEAKTWNKVVVSKFDEQFVFFMPQNVDLTPFPISEFDKAAYEADIKGMKGADFLLVLPPYGRDCAFEIGWFSGQGKPTIAYVEEQGEWIRDAMVKGGLTAIITSNRELYENLLKDAATVEKSYFILSKDTLKETVEKIVKNKKVDRGASVL